MKTRPIDEPILSKLAGPLVVAEREGGETLEVRSAEQPDVLASLGCNVVGFLSRAGAVLGIEDLHVLSVRSPAGATCLAVRAHQILVACDRSLSELPDAERAVAAWRSGSSREGGDEDASGATGVNREPANGSQQPASLELPVTPALARHGPEAPPSPKKLHRLADKPPPRQAKTPRPATPSVRSESKSELWSVCRAVGTGSVSKARREFEALTQPPLDPSKSERLKTFAASMDRVISGVEQISAGDATRGLRALLKTCGDPQESREIRWTASFWAARGALERGDLAHAKRLVSRALDHASELGREAQAMSIARASEVMLADGRPSVALERLPRARALLESIGDTAMVARSWCLQARAAAAVGRTTESAALAQRAVSLWPEAIEPMIFLATQAFAARRLSSAEHHLGESQHPDAIRLRSLIRLVRSGAITHASAAELIELRDHPQPQHVIQRLQGLPQGTPVWAHAAELLAVRLLRLGRYAATRAVCETALPRNPEPPAKASLEAILTIVPRNPSTSANRALTQKTPPAAGDTPLAGEDTSPSTRDSAFTGDLAEFSIPELLEFLRVSGRSGTLLCRGGAGVGILKLRKGNIVQANLARPSRGLPNTYRDDEPLSAQTTGENGAEILPGSQSHEDQIMDVLARLLDWKDGQFYFDPEKGEVHRRAGPEFDTQSMLLEVFRRMDEASARSGRETSLG